MDGAAEMQADILSYYKNPSTRFKAPLKVRFEGEDGVGVGPVREFFVEALSVVEEGFGNLALFPPPLQLKDLPYYDLRECIDEISFQIGK